ncbi:hypothetical protein [Bacteriophage sp.]|nr:hypothetical protein [Caudoviricetes sp.]UOF80015.1 hypothetical protein [Bacteriophage sp.]
MPVHRVKPHDPTLSHSVRGAQAELLACAWLLQHGYEVFRNVSPSGEFDLAVRRPGATTAELIDVTNGYWKTLSDGSTVVHVGYRKHQKPGLVLVYVDGEFMWLDDARIHKPVARKP